MMEMLFELAINVVETLLIISFISEYNGYKYEGNRRTVFFFATVVISFSCVTFFDSITHFSEFSTIPDFLINMAYCYLFLNGSFGDKFISCVLAMLGIIFTSTFSVFLFSIITGESIAKLILITDWFRIIFVVTTKILLYMFLKYILIFSENLKSHYAPKSVRFSILMVPIVTFVIMSLIMNMSLSEPIVIKTKIYAIASSIGLFAIDILVLVLFNKLSNMYKEKISIEINNMKYKNVEDMIAIYENLRIIKHNIKNDATTTCEFIKLGKYDKAMAVLQSIYKEVDEVRKFIITGNDALDVLINSKIGEAHEQGIKVIPIIEKNILYGMEERDVIILMGNLLDNAIEACIKNKNDKIIEIYMEEGNEIHITVKNTVDTPVLKINPNLLTTKADKVNHGLGIKSIEKVVKKYRGFIDVYDEDNSFCFSVIIKKIQK